MEPVAKTALIVPVPAAEPAVGNLRRRFDPSAEHGIPAHVTLLAPFLPAERIDDAVRAALAERAAATPPFAFELDRLDCFPGVVYLHPTPGDPFVALIRTWPNASAPRRTGACTTS